MGWGIAIVLTLIIVLANVMLHSGDLRFRDHDDRRILYSIGVIIWIWFVAAVVKVIT